MQEKKYKKILKTISNILGWLIKTTLNTTTILLLITLFGVMSGFFIFNEVEGTSMSPTFNSGDYVLSTTLFNEIKKNDVVIAESENENVIKRVIGTANDVLTFNEHSTLVNGLPAEKDLENPFIVENNYVVKEGEVFIVGDNRAESYDSRYYGSIDKNKIKRIVIFKIVVSDKLYIELVH